MEWSQKDSSRKPDSYSFLESFVELRASRKFPQRLVNPIRASWANRLNLHEE